MESSYLSVHSKNFAFKVPSKKFHSEMVIFHTYIPFLQKIKVPSQNIGVRAGKNWNFWQKKTLFKSTSLTKVSLHALIKLVCLLLHLSGLLDPVLRGVKFYEQWSWWHYSDTQR